MEADISGSQRKVVASDVRPARAIHGREGIPLQGGVALPFVVSREWSAPAGRYPEQWFLVHPETNQVLYESEVRIELMWGLQALTDVSSRVDDRIELQPGTYTIVFALGGLKGGEASVEAREVPAEAAA